MSTLKKVGADINAKNNNGNTPIEILGNYRIPRYFLRELFKSYLFKKKTVNLPLDHDFDLPNGKNPK